MVRTSLNNEKNHLCRDKAPPALDMLRRQMQPAIHTTYKSLSILILRGERSPYLHPLFSSLGEERQQKISSSGLSALLCMCICLCSKCIDLKIPAHIRELVVPFSTTP